MGLALAGKITVKVWKEKRIFNLFSDCFLAIFATYRGK
tara:strand:+ start:540 stop:653 length:114 start_codon:yes stop_codon:yes gene_type:complete